jgi:hypothetical protein
MSAPTMIAASAERLALRAASSTIPASQCGSREALPVMTATGPRRLPPSSGAYRGVYLEATRQVLDEV